MKSYNVLKDCIINGMFYQAGWRIEDKELDFGRDDINVYIEHGFIKEIRRPKSKTVYDLKVGDIYFRINANASIGVFNYADDRDDEGARAIGNMFLSRGDAEKELARRKAKQILLRDTKDFKPDCHGEGNLNCTWTIKWKRHYIDYKDAQGCMKDKPVWKLKIIHADDIYDQNLIYFASEEDAEASIKAHEKEWKIYLGVED